MNEVEMMKGQRRERVIRSLIFSLVLPFLTSIVGPGVQTAYAADTCTGPRIIGVQYSSTRLTTPEANLYWKRGTNTVLNGFLPTMLEWKRGTRTATSVTEMADIALKDFKLANPSTTAPTIEKFDDKFDTQTAVNKAREWAANPCFLALIGPTQSFIANAVIPIYTAAGIPILSPSASDPRLTTIGASTFHRLVLPEDPQDLRSILTLRALGITKPAIFEDDDQQDESRLSRWVRNPIAPLYSILEWKRGTPTVTSRNAIIADAKARGVNGYFFNGVSNYPEPSYWEAGGSAWPLVGEFSEVCAQCTGLVFGENMDAAYIDEKYFYNTGVEGARILATSVPSWVFAPNNAYSENLDMNMEGPYATPAYDAMRFTLEAIKAGNTTAQAVNTFINTKKYNGISGPISFDSKGELAGRSQIVMTVTNGQRVITSGIPANYTANGAISNHSATTPTTTSVALQIKDFDEVSTTSRVDLHTGPLVKSYMVGANGQINLSLPNGTSYISLTPDDDYEIGIRRVQYQVVVTNGAVTSFTNFASGVAITQSSSRYQVRLASPSAVGTVNSSVSYAGNSYEFSIEKTPASYMSTYLNAPIRSDNKIYITASARYNATGYIYANEIEDWSKRGYSKETFTAIQLAGSTLNFLINPPAAKITGQLSGSYGSGSYAQIQALVNNSYYKGFYRSPISSDGHFGFQKPDDRFETCTVKVYAYGDSGVRATGISPQFTYKASDTKTVSNLSISVPANNVTGVISLAGFDSIGILAFSVYRGSGNDAHQFTGRTNINGEFNLGLPQDTYTITVNGGYRAKFNTTTITCVVKSGSNTCNMALAPPTVTGTITGLTDITGGDVSFWKEISLGSWGFTSKNVFAYISADGKFYGYIEPGTYLMKVTARTQSGTYSLTAGKCTIPSTGTATCNIAFAPGLAFKLLNNDGQNFSGSLGITIKNIDTATLLAGNKGTFRYNPATGFTYPLLPGKYSITLDPHSNSASVGATSEFRFEFTNNAVTSLVAVESNTAISPVNGFYTLRLAKPQFEAILLKNNGGAVNYTSRVWLRYPNGSSSAIGTTTSAGNYVFAGTPRLTDGVYSLWTTPMPYGSSITGVESKPETFTVVNGLVAQRIEVREFAPNVTGTVTGPIGPMAGRQISISSYAMKIKGYWYPIRATTDSNGRYSVYLPPGQNNFNISGGYDLGVVGLNQSCQVAETGTVCNFVMKAPNVISQVTVGGNSSDYGSVSYLKADQRDIQFEALDSWGEGSKFVANIPAGVYRPYVLIWKRDAGGSTPLISALGNECVVPETGTVTCDTNFEKVNFEFSVYDFKGIAPIKSGSHNLIEYVNDPKDQSKNIAFTLRNYKNSAKNYSAILPDGPYRLTIEPYGKDANTGNIERYLFDVTNGNIANMRVDGSTERVLPVNGVYNLKLKSPAISGRVVATDGTTGISYTEVRAELNGVEYFDSTDSNGYFSFDLGSTVTDGTYVVTARAPYGNASYGESAKINVVVAGGVGNSVTVTLRTPNLVGVVRGPLGVSKSNWLNIYRLIPNGKSEYMRWGNQHTDNQGRYGFRFEPGEYSITTNDDFVNTGGTAARDVKCTVPETGTVTCNIDLIAPNVRGTFTNAGVATNGYVEVQEKTSGGIFRYIGKWTYSNRSGWFINLPSGTYRARGYSWDEDFTFFSNEFSINDTSTVNVAIEIPAVNLNVQVVSASGVLQTQPTDASNSSVYVIRYDGPSSYGFGTRSNNGQQSGQIKLRLSDGVYSLNLQTNNAQIGTPKEYSARVESGTVTELVDARTGVSVMQSNGIYQLQMGQPTISGTVVAPNGTTPVPGAMVGYFADGQVCPWCERDRVWTGNNGYFGFGNVPDGQYQIYARPNSGDITKGKSDLTAVTISGGQPQNGITLSLRDANVTGTIRGIEGAIDGTYINVQRRDGYGKNGTPYGVYDLRANSQGSFGLYLEPGTYRFIASIYTNGWSRIKSGFSQDCVVLNAGSVSCDINVNTSNISMKIVNPGTQTVMQNAHIGVYAAQYDSNLSTTNPQVSQNSNGVYTSYLENAIWRVEVHGPNESSDYARTYYNVTVENGAVTRVENEQGETLTAVDGTYLFSPKSTNLRGAITFNGTSFPSEAYVRVQSNSNGWWSEVAGRWSYGGNFGVYVAPGAYRIVVDPYTNGLEGAPVITTVYNCVVPESGTATCNIALSAGNLSGRIVDENGAVYRQAYINLYRTTDDGKWDYVQVSVNNGVFKSNLTDGKYRIYVVPYWDVRGSYTENIYEIQVTNNIVTSVTNTRTSETVTATNGTYNFALGMPAIRGRVLAPGTSTLGIEDIEIRVGTDATLKNWQYSTRSAANGSFALTVPDGTYVVQAIPFGAKTRYGKSESQTVVVVNGSIETPITLRLREPNFFGRVVTPGASPVPVSGVNVNIWIDGEYFYSYTGSDGAFAAFVDNPNPNCPNNCSLQLGYYQSTEFSSKNYAINSLGNIGDKALGGVSTRARVLAPASGSATTANRYGYVAVEQWNRSTSNYEWMPSSHTNELGLVGLSLDIGEKYRLTAYPGEGNYSLFSPKILEVESFSAIDSPTITIIFDRPNISLQVSNIAGAKNMWGWYRVSKYNSVDARYEYFKDGYLDDQGKGALLLPQGDFSIHFWPGKISAGVEREILVSVNSAGLVTGTSVVNGVATVVLPNGNVSGYVRNQSAVGLNAVVVTAVRDNDPTKMVSTVTGANGYYELNLDRSHAWTIKAIEPISVSNGQYALSTDSPSNAATSSADITITINP